MSTTACFECGTGLDARESGGICAACLFGAAIGTEDRASLGRLAGCDLLEEIARGGMGVVYRARQHEPERDVALKVLPGAALLSGEARLRFRLEARAMAALDHPHILPVYGFGEEDGTPWFTMKLAAGGSLAQRRDEFRGDFRRIAVLMQTAADAVHHAHARGVLHRDLKPGNILFDEADRALVADFGLAKMADSEAGLTRPMSVMGTPHYMAPEASAGPDKSSAASDLWSLGVILYELLAGHLPYSGDSVVSVLRKVLETEFPALPRTVPRDLAVITGKCLNKEPGKRYSSAAGLAEDLRRWLADEPIAARSETFLERCQRKVRRNPLAAALTGLLLASATAAAVLLVLGNARLAESLESARTARDSAKSAGDRLRINLYAADLGNAQRAMQNSHTARARELLAAYLPQPGEPDLRGFGWHWLHAQMQGDPHRVLTGHAGRATSLRFLPDGAMYSTGMDGTVRRWNTAAGTSEELLRMPGGTSPTLLLPLSGGSLFVAAHQGAWIWDGKEGPRKISRLMTPWWAVSPDGRWFAAQREWSLISSAPQNVVLIPSGGGAAVELADSGNWGVFSPDGTEFVSGARNGKFRRWTGPGYATAGEMLEGEEGPESVCSGLTFSPDGKKLAGSTTGGLLVVWGWPSGRRIFAEKVIAGKAAWRPVFSPDGRRIAVGGSDQTVVSVDSATGKVLRRLRGHEGEVNSVAFSPDGQLYSTAKESAIFEWDEEAGAAQPAELPTIACPPVFSSDGRFMAGTDRKRPLTVWETAKWAIASQIAAKESEHEWPLGFTGGDGVLITTIRFWNVTRWDWRAGKKLSTVILEKQPGESGWSVLLSPDSRWLAGGTVKGTVLVWDTESGKLAARLEGHEGEIMGMRFSPDGRRLMTGGKDRQPRIWTTADWKCEHVLPVHGHFARNFAFTPDGREAVTSAYDGLCRFFDLKSGALTGTLTGDTTSLEDILFLRDGHTLAVQQNNNSVLLIDTRSRRETVRLQAEQTRGNLMELLAQTPDGRLLMGVNYTGTVAAEWRIRAED